MKSLVIYFSKSGKTKKQAEQIAKTIGADTFEIVTEKEYPGSFFKTVAESKREFDSDEKPALKTEKIDLSEYDKILIGFPVWFGTCPMAVISFIEKNDFVGKKIYPFCTSGAGGCEKGRSDIAKYAIGADVRTGIKANKLKASEVLAWVEK